MVPDNTLVLSQASALLLQLARSVLGSQLPREKHRRSGSISFQEAVFDLKPQLPEKRWLVSAADGGTTQRMSLASAAEETDRAGRGEGRAGDRLGGLPRRCCRRQR